jgi:AraC-like DNA-binding protein
LPTRKAFTSLSTEAIVKHFAWDFLAAEVRVLAATQAPHILTLQNLCRAYPLRIAMESNGKVSVVVLHGCTLVAAGIIAVLSGEPDIEVADRAIRRSIEPDIMIGSCEEAVKLKSPSPCPPGAHPPRVLVVILRETESEVRAALESGIDGCLSIDCAQDELVAAVRSVLRGDGYLIPSRLPFREPLVAATRPAPPPARGGLAPGALRRVREHIDANLESGIAVRTLATIAGLSACHFARAFKQSLGVPPHRYVLQRRIARAVQMIRDTDLSLSEIALSVGCADQSHFTTLFTRLVGETPRAYRRAFR